MVCQLRKWNLRKPTRSGENTSTTVGGSHVVIEDGQYPKFLEQHLVLVGYEHTRMGKCSGRACKLNDGRETIKVASSRSQSHCRNVAECVTITIKTKGRLHWVKHLIESARRSYPNIRFVVADELDTNAKDGSPEDLPPFGVVYVKLKPGIGFGRKMAIKLAETKYALIADYDFVFTEHTNLTKMVDLLERSNAAIVGGSVDDGAFFEGIFRVADRCTSGGCHPGQFNYAGAFYDQVPLFEHCYVADRVKNFFLADRQAVLAAGSWDTSRPFFEHEDFFVQMRRSGLTVAFCKDVQIHHNTTDRYLAGMRHPIKWTMQKHFLDKWDFAGVYECSLHMYHAQSCCESCRAIGPEHY